MENFNFDLRELDLFEKELLSTINDKLPKESKKFLRKEGTKLKKTIKNIANRNLEEYSGNYLKGIKRGKPYIYRGNGSLSIRAYNSTPHAHLIEYGHRQTQNNRVVNIDGKFVTLKKFPKKKRKGFVKDKRVLKKASKEFDKIFYYDTRKFLDEILKL